MLSFLDSPLLALAASPALAYAATLDNAGRLAITQKQLSDSALVTLSATDTDNKTVFEPVSRGGVSPFPLTYGVRYWFAGRASNGGWIVRSIEE
ncbi:uncharacterized protein BDV14DRAFT_168034 [Aspergillus stella-maris]|uniref:uncharacterized protein n=1 Tax=Aspergillus stella-maris TaxID=1810926 RepID=UPI003CCDE946